MKDRNAFVENRKFVQGVPADEGKLKEPGVLAGSVKGEPYQPPGTPAAQGIAFPAPGPADDQSQAAPMCISLTKKGAPCKAHPVKGMPLCIGHARQ